MMILISLSLFTGVDALHINKIEAPEHAFTGDTVTFKCDYDLEGGNLQHVKWFHENVMFYQYRAADGSWAFPKKSMTVDVSKNKAVGSGGGYINT